MLSPVALLGREWLDALIKRDTDCFDMIKPSGIKRPEGFDSVRRYALIPRFAARHYLKNGSGTIEAVPFEDCRINLAEVPVRG